MAASAYGLTIINLQSMTIEKCDICKQEITDEKTKVYVGMRHRLPFFELCGRCGAPIRKFLVKHKLEGPHAEDEIHR